jgi:hypothetical protein
MTPFIDELKSRLATARAPATDVYKAYTMLSTALPLAIARLEELEQEKKKNALSSL